MDDQDIERLLRRYTPVGPSPDLRARIVTRVQVVRLWPWAAAASVLLLGVSALHIHSNRIERGVIAVSPADPAAAAVRDLAEVLGGGEIARMFAQAEIARLQRDGASSLSDERETP